NIAMAILNIKPADSCKYDLLALGEIMLRLDPGEGRVRTARAFTAWEGGGEYNVARGLRRCFGLRTAVCTAFADNDVGRLIEDFDWDDIFGTQGVRWLHTGGIFAALSDTTPDLVEEAVQAAKMHGTVVSYDLNYRPSLWKSIGGHKRAQEVNRRIAKFVDVMIGNEEDFTACLGFEVEGADEHLSKIDVAAFQRMIGMAVKVFPNFKVAATTLRAVRSANRNDWGAICWANGKF